MFKSIKKYLVLLILIITAALTSVGYSAFVLSERVSNEATQSAIQDSSPVVSIKYETIKTTKTVGPETIEVNYTGTDATNYNTYYNKYKKQYGSIDVGGFFSTSATYNYLNPPEELDPIVSEKVDDGNGNLTWTETTYYIYLLNTKTGKATLGSSKTFYGVKISYIITTYTYGSSIEIDSSGNQIVFNRYTLKNGEKLSKPTLYRNGYAFVDFYKSNSNGTAASDELFDFNTPITSNTTIFAKWTELKDDNGGTISSTKFADYINGVSGTGNVYNGSSGYDISSDPTYSLDSKKVSLTSANVKSGATINFSMNSGITNLNSDYSLNDNGKIVGNEIANETGSVSADDPFVSVDYTKNSTTGPNNRDYTIVLQGDLTINGKLVIGGLTGTAADGNPAEHGYIIGSYVCLDLNGHKITINSGGILHSFGLIKDSKGSGLIDVKQGGILMTQFVVLDLGGGNNTLWSYAKNFCPFNNYSLPYLQCNVKLNAGNSTTISAMLYGFCKLNLGSLGVTNIYIPFFGNDVNGELFLFDYDNKSTSTDGCIEYSYIELDDLISGNVNTYENKNQLFIKNNFVLNNVEVKNNNAFAEARVCINGIPIIGDIRQSFNLNLDRINFSISSLFAIYLKNSNFTINQTFIFQPGAILEADVNSVINFDFNKNSNGVETPKSFSKFSVATKTFPGSSRYTSGSLISLNRKPENNNSISSVLGLYSSSKTTVYWKYYKRASINIYGNINFITGNTNEPFELAGNININTFTINGGTRYKWNKTNITNHLSSVNLNTFAIEYNVSNCFWFNGDNVLATNNSGSYVNVNEIYTLPLISNSKTYIYGDGFNVEGMYNENTGITTGSDGKTYIFLTGKGVVTTDYSNATSSSEAIQEAAIDYSITPAECIIEGNYAKIGTQYYIYFGGNMFPCTYVSDTSCTANITKFTTYIGHANFATFKNQSFTFDSTTSKWKKA